MSSPRDDIPGWESLSTALLIRRMFERMLDARDAEKNSAQWKNLMHDVMEIQWELQVRLHHTDPEGLFDGQD